MSISSKDHILSPVESTKMNALPYWLHVGKGPLLISAPHHGVEIPQDIERQMTDCAKRSEDTDWYMRELYLPIAQALDATLLCARYSRYVIDLNRPRSDESLYPGQRSTGLCPSETFHGQALYPPEFVLSDQHKSERITQYWDPYHQALNAQISRLKKRYKQVLLWEAHSIKSVVPLLFEGQLPDFNLGTYDGRSCHALIEQALTNAWQSLPSPTPWSFVLNGRFKGGYITRAYGKPKQGIHAVQLELSQRVYLEDEGQPTWQEGTQHKAQRARPYLLTLIEACLKAMQTEEQSR